MRCFAANILASRRRAASAPACRATHRCKEGIEGMAARNVIVTGAASGIGRESVTILLGGDTRIAALDLQLDTLERDFAGNAQVRPIGLDLASAESCSEAVGQAIAWL